MTGVKRAPIARAARRNAERNGLQWVDRVDVFTFLRAAEQNAAEFDLIILDPPSFTKTKAVAAPRLRTACPRVCCFQMDCWRRFRARTTTETSTKRSPMRWSTLAVGATVAAFRTRLDPGPSTLPKTGFQSVLLEMMPGR